MLFQLDIAALCLNRKVISRLMSSFHPIAKLMSRPCHDGWPLSGSSRVIDFYGNSSECNQTSETLNTHVRTHILTSPVDLKGVIVNVKTINVSRADWEDLPRAYKRETLAWTFRLLFSLLSLCFIPPHSLISSPHHSCFFLLQEILGGPHAAEQRFDGEFFKKFRNQNIVLSARTYARVNLSSFVLCPWCASVCNRVLRREL